MKGPRRRVAKEIMAEAVLATRKLGGVEGTEESVPAARGPEEVRELGGARGTGESALVARGPEEVG